MLRFPSVDSDTRQVWQLLTWEWEGMHALRKKLRIQTAFK